MELQKNTVNICEIITKGTTQAMADGDVIVPDIKPDILKLLQVDAEACITDKYIENGRLIIAGRVDYKVLYVPDREHELIKSILTSMEFRQAVDAAGADADSVLLVSTAVERVEFNAVNSRKLRLRAIVHADYEICRIKESEICTGCSDSDMECKTRNMSFESVCGISEHEFTIKETLEVPSGQSSVCELLKTDVRISDMEYKTVTGKVIVKGNAGVCILYTDDDGAIRFIESEIPFTEVLDADGVSEDTVCDIDYSTLGIMCETHPDSDGDLRMCEVDIDLCASVRGTENMEMEVLEDCFAPYKDTECDTESVTVTETIERPISQNTIREIIDFPSNVPSVSGVYNVMTNVNVTKAELQRNKIICEGKIEAYILYLTDTDENPVYSIKKDIPFSYMLECENACDGAEIGIKAVVRHVSYNLNSTGGLELRCLLSIEGRLQRKTELNNICDVHETERSTNRGIVIYFVQDGDNLWHVAKKYGVPRDRIKECNSMESDKISSGEKLFIPSR